MAPKDLDDQLDTAATYGTAFDAELAQEFLASKGVPAFFVDDAGVMIPPHRMPAATCIHLRVRGSDAFKAGELLSTIDI